MRLTNGVLFPLLCAGSPMAGDYSVAEYPSIQAALDANPGRVAYVPSGDYEISGKIRLGSDRSGLVGPGRIIQRNSDQPIIEIEKAEGIQIRGLTLTRPDGRTETSNEGIIANHIENAAQGIDLHADHVIVANNIVTNSFVGMKAMHGSRNVLITGNQFTRNSLWAIGLMPGAAAHPDNADGGSIIANNIISDFGHGDAHWIWGNERAPIRFDTGQQPDDPPLTDVIVQGNNRLRYDCHWGSVSKNSCL